ncbi:MAG TPA: hypothetical protein VGT04_16215 [Acidobacteriaceae bacterium]|nr:hypothetical protein [Acidobacteriaceae bacterium]
MSPEVLAFAKKLAEGARAKALEDQRRLQIIRKEKAEKEAASHQGH